MYAKHWIGLENGCLKKIQEKSFQKFVASNRERERKYKPKKKKKENTIFYREQLKLMILLKNQNEVKNDHKTWKEKKIYWSTKNDK